MAWGDLLRPVLTDYLNHPEDGPYWWASNVERQHANINIPMYHVTSWYDIFLHGGLTHYCGLRQHAMTPETRAQQKLLVGPWAHRFPYTAPSSGDTGDIDFGPNARIELHETQLRWFDYYLKGIDTGILDEPPVKIFVMGENFWRDEQEWPLARTRYTPYYLRSQGQANSLHGDGRLELAPPADETGSVRLRPGRPRAYMRR